MAKPQIARVGVNDERWMAFRQAALSRGLSVSAYLGRLVDAELKRREGRALATVTPELPAQDQAIGALAEVRNSIDELNDLAGRLARLRSLTGLTGPTSGRACGCRQIEPDAPTSPDPPDFRDTFGTHFAWKSLRSDRDCP